jgi:hypothetical protein
MAVDTRDKRFSILGLASDTVREQQNPTGTIGAPARAMLLFLYAGIALASPAAAVAADNAGIAIDMPELGMVSPGTLQGGDGGGLN